MYGHGCGSCYSAQVKLQTLSSALPHGHNICLPGLSIYSWRHSPWMGDGTSANMVPGFHSSPSPPGPVMVQSDIVVLIQIETSTSSFFITLSSHFLAQAHVQKSERRRTGHSWTERQGKSHAGSASHSFEKTQWERSTVVDGKSLQRFQTKMRNVKMSS